MPAAGEIVSPRFTMALAALAFVATLLLIVAFPDTRLP